MEGQPSFSSRVESLPEYHPFRVIFKQVKKNLAHLSISLDGSENNEGRIFYYVPHDEEKYKGDILVKINTDSRGEETISVHFEQEIVRHSVQFILTFLPDSFGLDYTYIEWDRKSLEENGRKTYGENFCGSAVWYKKDLPINRHNIDESPRETSYLDDIPQIEPVIWERLIEIVFDQEAYFEVAQKVKHLPKYRSILP